jgi:hypothetical protein
LQVLSGPGSPPFRMVEPIVRSTFGPRVGHEMLSGVTTSHTPLRVADVHRASSLELLLTMSSDRQLVLTRHDLHQLLAKTETRPDHTPRRLTRPNTCANTCARIGRTRSLFPRAGGRSAPARTTACRPSRASADEDRRRSLAHSS